MIPFLLSIAFFAQSPAGVPARQTFDVLSFGVKRDSPKIQTQAIQAAINKANAAGGGTVRFPSGTFLTGTLHLKSHVTLHLDKDARLLGSPKLSDYERGNWPAMIMAEGQEDIAITGLGTLDGNSPALVREFDRIKASKLFLEFYPQLKRGQKLSFIGSTGNPTEVDPHNLMEKGKLEKHVYHGFERPSESVRPQVIEFRKCKDVRVSDVTITNSANWVQSYRDCSEMKFHRMKVRSTQYWNNDGIDLVDCQKVEMYDCDIDSADDALCLKSEPFGKGCQDIVVSRIKLASRASAIKFGTASHIAFKRIYISDVEVRDTYRSAVAIQSVDGAEIEDVTVERLKAVNTGNAIFVRLGHRNQKRSPGSIRGVVLRDINVEVPALPKDYHKEIGKPHNLIPSSIAGIPGHVIEDVKLERIKISYGGGADPIHAKVPLEQLNAIPENERDYPEFSMWAELPAWGFFLRHTQGVTLRDVEFTLKTPDFRSAIVASDSSDLKLEQVAVGDGGGEPILHLSDSPRAQVINCRFPDGAERRIRKVGSDSFRASSTSTPAWVDNTRARVYSMADRLQRTLRPWNVPDREFDIAKFGAKGDGKTINTRQIQSAVDACSLAGGGTVVVQGGDFVTGTLDFRSNVMLEVRKSARLLSSTNITDYPDRLPLTKTVMDSNMDLRQSLFYAERCVNIGFRGEGVIDGRGTKQNFPGPTTIAAVTGRPFLIRVIECSNVAVQGITLRDAAAWMQSYLNCTNVILDGVTVDSRVNGNNDGIDIDSCVNVIVRNCLVRSGDDAMCFKGAGLRATENVLVENCEFTTWCNAIKFGTDTQGAFRNVLVRNCRLGGNPGGEATTGITWASVDGGMVQDIICENLTINRTGSPIFIRRGSRGRTMPGLPKPVVGEIKRIVIENVVGSENGQRGSMIAGIPGHPVRDIYLRLIRLDGAGGAPADAVRVQVPENESGYPDAGWFGVKLFPAFGFYIRHAEDVTLDDVLVTRRLADPRDEIVFGPFVRRIIRLRPEDQGR